MVEGDLIEKKHVFPSAVNDAPNSSKDVEMLPTPTMIGIDFFDGGGAALTEMTKITKRGSNIFLMRGNLA